MLRTRGVASLLETITLAEGLPERVLAAVDGERRMTDLRHVGQLLHAAATTEQLGTTALVGWLRRRIAEADQDDERRGPQPPPGVRRTGGPGPHRPPQQGPRVRRSSTTRTCGSRGSIPPGLPVAYHDPDEGDRRTIDVGLEGQDFDRHKEQHPLIEERGEDLRLAYVALDAREASGCRVVGAVVEQPRVAARAAAVRARGRRDRAAPSVAARRVTRPRGERFATLAAEAPGCISVERSQPGAA